MKKYCAITGASGGVGEDISLALSKKYNLVLIGSNKKKLDDLKKKILKKNFCEIFLIQSDFSKVKSIIKTCSLLNKKKIEVLINNAGVFEYNHYIREKDKRTLDIMNINLISHMLITKSILKNMKKKRNGRVIFIGSTSSHRGIKNTISYCASKHGLLGFSRSINEEYNKFNIFSSFISPGSIKTKMSKKLQDKNRNSFIKTNEIANYVNFILSEENNSFLNEILIRRKSV